MIKYNLKCNSCYKNFDSWFSFSREYEKLKKLKHLMCLFCNSTKVEKTLMSPNIQSSKNKTALVESHQKTKDIKNTIKNYQNFIKRNFEYVGDNFAYKVRTLHYKKVKNFKGIYGNASKEEISDLNEEGITTDVIPWYKDIEN